MFNDKTLKGLEKESRDRFIGENYGSCQDFILMALLNELLMIMVIA